jgi:hypothetical protein
MVPPKKLTPLRQDVALKTTIRFGRKAQRAIDRLLVDAGVSRNSFFVLSILTKGVQLAKTMKAPKAVLDVLEREFNKELKEARAELS